MCVILYRLGDEVVIIFHRKQPSPGLLPEDGDLDIVYEDEAIIIVDKPAGQSTIPSRDHPVRDNCECGCRKVC